MIRRFLFALLLVASPAGAATYHISTTGNDANDGLSAANAWATFAYADLQLNPGDTLLIADGTYDQRIKTTHSGTADGGYITYKAQHDYGVILAPSVDTGEDTIDVFSCPNCGPELQNPLQGYLKFEGIISRAKGENTGALYLHSADNATVDIMTHHIIIRKCGFFGDAQETNQSVIELGVNLRDSLIEDIFSYGKGRKGGEVFGGLRVTVRRAVVRYDYWEGDDYKPNDPRTTFDGYNTQDSIFENIIAIDAAETPPGHEADRGAFAAAGNETPAALSGSIRNKYLGLVILNNPANGVEVHGGSGDPNEDLVFKNILSWGATDGGDGFNVQSNDDASDYSFMTIGNNAGSGFRLDPNPGSPITNEIIKNIYVDNNGIRAFTYDDNQVATFENNTGTNINEEYESVEIEPQYAPDISQRFLDPVMVAGHERGATIVNRYVDGVLTSTPLWPWPNEDIIKQHMCDAADLAIVHRSDPNDPLFVGKPGWCETNKTLTEYIWEFNGATCPGDICAYAGPLRSNPLPVGVQSENTVSVQMEITTDVAATCKYGANGATGVDYATMANTMSGTGTSHTATISGLANGNSYSRAVRCTDGSETNDTDFIISWSVAADSGSVVNTILSGTGSFITGGGHFKNTN